MSEFVASKIEKFFRCDLCFINHWGNRHGFRVNIKGLPSIAYYNSTPPELFKLTTGGVCVCAACAKSAKAATEVVEARFSLRML